MTTARLNPITTPRFEDRAEKARRNQGEPGSATGSRNRANALAAFIGKKAEIDEMLARLQALSDDHFGFDPEAVNWGSVGPLEHVASDLREITHFLFREGEYAR